MLAGCCRPSVSDGVEEVGFDDGKPPKADEDAEGGDVKDDDFLGADAAAGAAAEAEEATAEETLYCKGACGRKAAEGIEFCCHSCGLNRGLGFHDVSCGQDWDAGDVRPVCPSGSMWCKGADRSLAHLEEMAHPLDKDYAICCAHHGVCGESLSCKVIFDWADADGSGKLNRTELKATMDQLIEICGSTLPALSEASWQSLDEDGNGVVNFGEFAAWAGPRIGLPLGVETLMSSMSLGKASSPCHIMNCPCEHFMASDASSEKCKVCKHAMDSHKTKERDAGSVPVPEYWDASGKDGEQNLVTLDKSALGEFQELLTKAHVKKWTRDRRKHNPDNPNVPKGYKVVRVHRNENVPNWTEYACRRAEVNSRVQSKHTEFDKYLNVKSTVAFREVAGPKADRLLHELNEWYLFHGTNPEIAKLICGSDFRVSCAGGNTGTLYGKGLYFAEAITKADEYAKPDKVGNYAVLLCRVLGGNVRYTADVDPDPEELVKSCIEGPYDCVLGDREKCRGTFREFCIFDSEGVYPEYIIEYTRDYGVAGAKAAPAFSPGGEEGSKIAKLQFALREAKEKHGERHAEVAAALTNLANAHNAQKEYPTAIKLFEESITLKEELFGSMNPGLAVSLSGMGAAYGALHQFKKQVEVLQRALKVRAADKGEDSPDLAPTLANLGIAYRRLGNPTEALRYMERALALKEKKFSHESAEVAITLGNVAQVYGDLKNTAKQRELLLEALAILERTRGASHPHTQLARNAIAACG